MTIRLIGCPGIKRHDVRCMTYEETLMVSDATWVQREWKQKWSWDLEQLVRIRKTEETCKYYSSTMWEEVL